MKSKSNQPNQFLNWINQSKQVDLFGVGIVLTLSIYHGFLLKNLGTLNPSQTPALNWIPIGLISLFASILSILSSRLKAKINNLGNYLSIACIILNGFVDYLLGNQSGIITYPLVIIINFVAIKNWKKTNMYQVRPPMNNHQKLIYMPIIITLSLITSFTISYFTFNHYGILFWLSSVVFAFVISISILNALKLTIQWHFQIICYVIQLIKALIQHNFADVGQYIYSIINAIAALAHWKNIENQNSNVRK